MEKVNIAPIHKKGDEQTVKNYPPGSHLSICGKTFEGLLYNKKLYYFQKMI